jgi:hypothetical protein
MRFRNNDDLHVFVEELLEFLRSRQEIDLADLLARANRYLSVSPAEHLSEVELALTRVLVLMPKSVSGEREDEIRQVVRQIGESFDSTRGT